MFLRSVLLFLGIFFLPPSIGLTGNEVWNSIEMLNHDIKRTQPPKEKGTLLIYRARQYSKIKEWEKALEDYNDALELNHKGWIHLERSHFLMIVGRFDLAYEDAEAAKKEVPTLALEADKIMDAAVEEIRKKYEAENPLTITMDTKVDPYRKTRFDLMREQGVFVAKERRSANLSRTKKITQKKKAAACNTKKSRRG
jgi:tetratricopeptide (TPR) repeat protein